MKLDKYIPDTTTSLGGAILIIVFGIGGILYQFEYGPWSVDRTQIWLEALAAIGTLLLVLVYIRELLENRQHRERERDRNIQSIILNDILRPSIRTATHNEHTLRLEYIEYASHRFVQIPTGEGHEDGVLYVLSSRKDIEPGDQRPMEDEYPDLYDRLEEHDELLYELSSCVDSVFNTVWNGHDIAQELPQSMDAHHPEIQEEITNLYLNSGHSAYNRSTPEGYYDHVDEIHDLFETYASEELEEYRQTRNDYERHLFQLKEDLTNLKGNLRGEYGI